MYNDLLSYGDFIQLNNSCNSKQLLDEIKEFEWIKYNPRKDVERYGLSVTSSDGTRNGVDLGATANNDNVVISAPSGNDDWITLFYARAHDSGETLPIPISADIVIAIKDGTYPASDLTTINITNITSI